MTNSIQLHTPCAFPARPLQEDIDPLEIDLSIATLQNLRAKIKSQLLNRFLEGAEHKIGALTEVDVAPKANKPSIVRPAV